MLFYLVSGVAKNFIADWRSSFRPSMIRELQVS
jgi:hypothetical protein